MQGQDAQLSEYWFFKDEPDRLFIKTAEDAWLYIDEEDEFNQLLDSLNLKGVREKRLQESLRKLRGAIKMKKSKRTPAKADDGDTAMAPEQTSPGKSCEKEQEGEQAEEQASAKQEAGHSALPESASQKHHLFEDDHYEQTIVDAVWFSKTMPKRRKNATEATMNASVMAGMRSRVTRSAGNGQDEIDQRALAAISLPNLKSQLLDIEQSYSETMANLDREWETPEIRAKVIEEVKEAKDIDELYRLLDRIEMGFADPYQVSIKKDAQIFAQA